MAGCAYGVITDPAAADRFPFSAHRVSGKGPVPCASSCTLSAVLVAHEPFASLLGRSATEGIPLS